MCLPLEKVNKKSAVEILKQFNQYDSIPVDILKILSDIGAIVIEDDLSFLEENPEFKERINKYGELCGLILATKDDLGIFYKKLNVNYEDANSIRSAKHRSRFTLAHELAHCALHAENLEDGYLEFRFENGMKNIDDNYSRLEEQANIFAGELLIPEHSLNKILNELEVPSIKALSEIFDVSSNVMKARMDHLGKSYLSDERQ